jgi:hypothetical protein
MFILIIIFFNFLFIIVSRFIAALPAWREHSSLWLVVRHAGRAVMDDHELGIASVSSKRSGMRFQEMVIINYFERQVVVLLGFLSRK